MEQPPAPPSRFRSLKLVLLVLVVVSVATMTVGAVPPTRLAAQSIAKTWRCFGLEDGTVQSAEGPFSGGPAPEPSADPKLAVIHYMAGDGFLGPGDSAFAGPVQRDILNPPLEDGEPVSFDGFGEELRVTRSCD